MPDTLAVHVNRDELHGLDVPNSFETTGSFVIDLTNHGEPLHVHLHLDDGLSNVAQLEATNHYVEGETTRSVQVAVDDSVSTRGKLKVVTAYGATTRYIDIVLKTPEESQKRVEIDESLNKPKPRPSSGPTGGGPTDTRSSNVLTERPELGVLALGGGALLLAAYAVLVLQNAAVALGALVVLAGVLVAVYLLVQ